MGRFYQTSQAKMLDFTLKLPEELMMKSVEFNDQMINQSLAGLDQLTQMDYGNALGEIDTQRMKEINQEYQNKIDTATNTLYNNTLNWRNIVPDIKNIGKQMYYDKTRGEWGNIEGNFNSYQAWSQQLDELVKSNPEKFTPEDIQKLKAYMYNKWEGTNYNSQTQTGNTFSGIAPAEYVDLGAFADLRGKGFKADANTTYGINKDGGYWRKTINGIEQVDPKEVYTAVSNAMYGDPKIMSYLQQRFMVDSTLNPEFGEQFRSLTTTDGKPIVDINGKEIGNSDDPMQNYIDYMIYNNSIPPANKYGYRKTKQGTTGMIVDQYALADYKGKIARQNIKFKKQLESGNTIPTKIYSKKVINQILKKEEFTPAGIQENIDTTRQTLKNNKEYIANIEVLLGKTPEGREVPEKEIETIYKEVLGGTYSGELTPEQRTYLEDLETKYKIQYNVAQEHLDQLRNIGTVANNSVTNKLLGEGYTSQQIEFYKKNYNRFDEIEKSYSAYNQVLLTYNLYNNEDVGFEPINQFMDEMLIEKYGEQRANQIISDHTNYKLMKDLKTKYGQELTNWYSENQTYNQVAFNGVDLRPFNTSTETMTSLYNAATDPSGVYASDVYVNPSSKDYTTQMRTSIFNKKGFQFKNISQTEFNNNVTPISMTAIGNEYVAIDFQVNEELVDVNGKKIGKLKDEEGQEGIIRMVYKRDSGIVQRLINNITENKVPGDNTVATSVEAMTNPTYDTILTISNNISENVVGDGTTPTNYATPQTMYWFKDTIKTDITPSTVNGNTTYYVNYYTRNNEGKYVPITRQNENGEEVPIQVFYTQNGNIKPTVNIASDIFDLYSRMNSKETK